MLGAPSDLFAAGAHIGENCFQSFLLDRAHGIGRETQRHPTLLFFQPETLRMQIGQETAPTLVVGVGNRITGDLTDATHESIPRKTVSYKKDSPAGAWRKGSLYTSRKGVRARSARIAA